jgi:hypothetical protein
MVEQFLVVMRNKLLNPSTYEINISLNKGLQKVSFGKLLLDQKFDGRETYVIKLNHNGDL